MVFNLHKYNNYYLNRKLKKCIINVKINFNRFNKVIYILFNKFKKKD